LEELVDAFEGHPEDRDNTMFVVVFD